MILILTKLQSQVPVSSDSDSDTGSDQVTQEEGLKVAGFIYCDQFVPSIFGFKKTRVWN